MANMSSNKNGFLSKLFNFKSWRLQSKLLVPILLVVVLALGVTWATVSVIVANAITKEVRNNLTELAESNSKEVLHLVESDKVDLTLQAEKNIAINAIAEMAKWDKARKELEYRKSINFDSYKTSAASQNFYLTRAWLEQMAKLKNISEMMVMDTSGMTFCSTRELTDPNNASDDWFKEATKNFYENNIDCTVRGPEYDESSDDYLIYMTTPIRRAGENNVYGWVSTRMPISKYFSSAIEFNAIQKALGNSKSVAWLSRDFILVGIMETERIGTNIGKDAKTGKREIKFNVDKGTWKQEGDKVIVVKDGKEYKTEPSTLVGQIDRYLAYLKEHDDAVAKLDPKAKDYNSNMAKLKATLREKSFEFGVSSQGTERAYSVEKLGGHLGISDLGYIFTRQTRNEFMTPVINIGYIIFLLILILLIVTIIVLVLISRSLINPILLLRGSLVEVSLGNYDITVPVTTQDEVGDLGNTFNQMLQDIKKYIVSEEERNLKDREINELIDTLSKIAEGDLTVRADVPPDEIGALADSVNFLVEELSDKVQTEEAKEQQDMQIANLLTTVSEMSTGDMTQSAEVTADVLGAVADSVNYMGDQIRKILREVTRVTENISDTSSSILKSSDVISKEATEQQSIITDTSAAVDEMAISINQVSQSAESAAQAAENSAKIAEVGGRTVLEAVDAMNRIRGSVAEISKRIKKLGESSQEIGEIVNVISDIAAQTNMLALNAAIEAARAGEQGRGFSVVADAVRQLAERSTKSTKDITLLIRGIQSETSEAIKTMEDSTQEVVEGSKLAETAQERLSEIVTNSKQLADLISSISLSSRQQSRATEEVNKSMGMISNITNSSAQSIFNTAKAVYEMDALVAELGKAIKRFKI